MDVTSLMRQAAHLNAHHTAIVTDEGRVFTFAEAWTRGVRMANALRELGVRCGDRVAGLEDNNVGCIDLLLGAAIAGAVRVPLYTRNSRAAHASMLSGTDCRFVVTDEKYADSVRGLECDVDSLESVVVRGEDYEQWLASFDAVDPLVAIDGDDWFVIRHSGGTTGKPKGVGYTHDDWAVNCRNWTYAMERLRRDSVLGHAAPVSHGSGYLFLPAWLAGATNVVFGEFEPEKVLRMMREHRVSHMWVSPTLLASLCRHVTARDDDWPYVRSLFVSGSPITDATALLGREVFGDTLFQGFGQTEAVPIAIMGPEEWFGDRPGSNALRACGRVLPYARVEIRSEGGDVLPIGTEGIIWAQVEGQMRGYWGDDELTKQRLVDGWVNTQDIGKLDENGLLYVFDRADDLIISGGFNIWPAELETVIADHPAVREVAVFGIPSERWGETPMAVVVVEEGVVVDRNELMDVCRERLGSYKKPSRIEFTHEPLPKTPVGKLARKQLREPYWTGAARRIAGA